MLPANFFKPLSCKNKLTSEITEYSIKLVAKISGNMTAQISNGEKHSYYDIRLAVTLGEP